MPFTQETYQGSSLIIGDYPVHSEAVTISGGAALTKGTVLATYNGTYQKAVTGSGNFQVPVAVLAADADASGGNVTAPVYLSGKFDEAKCTKDSSFTAWSDVRNALRAAGVPVFIVPLSA